MPLNRNRSLGQNEGKRKTKLWLSPVRRLVSVNEEPNQKGLHANRGCSINLGTTLDEWRPSSAGSDASDTERTIFKLDPRSLHNRREMLPCPCHRMSMNLTAVLQELLQKYIESQGASAPHDAGRHRRSLNFDNAELKKVMPWTGIHKGLSMALQGCA